MAQKIKLKRTPTSGPSGAVPSVSQLDLGELAINTVDGKLFLKKSAAGVESIVEIGANPYPPQAGNAGKVLSTDGTSVAWSTPSSHSATSIDIPYAQSPAGVTPGMVVYHNGVKYEASQANSLATSDVIGIVTSINPGVSITISIGGFINAGWNPNWVPGTVYFLSPTVPGVLTDVDPDQPGQVSKPLLIATTSNTGFFYNWRGVLNDIPENNINVLLPPQSAGTIGQVLTSGPTGEAYWANGGAGSGAASTIPVNQSSHGFTVGTLVRYDGATSQYVRAQANTALTADVVGIVSAVANANEFTITTGGVVNTLSGLTAGATYFLSDATAGTYTTSEPSALTAISKPVLMALSATSAIFYNWRGIGISALSSAPEVAPQTGNAGRYLTTNGSATLWGTPVTSFNTRTGAVTLSSVDVTGALGFTPYDGATNPNNYVTASGAVTSFNGRVGAVVLNATDISGAGGALLASPLFTGDPRAPTPASGDNDTSVATTAFVRTAINTFAVGSFNGRTGNVTLTSTDITSAGGALTASPAFTGTPTAPTPALADNSTQIATTAFVTSKMGSGGILSGLAPASVAVGGTYPASTFFVTVDSSPAKVNFPASLGNVMVLAKSGTFTSNSYGGGQFALYVFQRV